MAQLAAALPIIVEAIDLASARLLAIEKSVERLGGKIEQTNTRTAASGKAASKAQAGLAAAIGVTGIAATAAAFNSGKFNLAVQQAGALAGASAKELAVLRNEVLFGTRNLSVFPNEAARAAQELTRLGLSAGEASKAIIPTLQLMSASLGQLGPAQAGGVIGQQLKLFKLNASESRRVAATLTAAAASSALAFNKLSLGIAITQTGASKLNASFEDTVAVTALIANLFPSRINRGVRAAARFMEDLAEPATRVNFAFLTGVPIVDKSGKKFRRVTEIIGDTVKVFNKLDDVQRTNLVSLLGLSQEGGRALLDFTNLSGAGLAKFNKEMVQSKGVFTAFADKMEEEGRTGATMDNLTKVLRTSLPGAAKESARALSELAIVVGSEIEKSAIPVLENLTNVLRNLTELFISMPAPLKKGIGTLGTLGIAAFAASLIGRGGKFLFKTPTQAAVGSATGGAGSGLLFGGLLAAQGGAGPGAAGAAAKGGRFRGAAGKVGRFAKGAGILLLIEEGLAQLGGNNGILGNLIQGGAHKLGLSSAVPGSAADASDRMAAARAQLNQLRQMASSGQNMSPFALQQMKDLAQTIAGASGQPHGGPSTGSSGSIAPRTTPPSTGARDVLFDRMAQGAAFKGGGSEARSASGPGGQVMLQPVEIIMDAEVVATAVLRFVDDTAIRNFDRTKVI